MHKAEAFFIAFGPFVIVQKRPVEEALHIGPIGDGAFGGGEMGEEEIFTHLIGQIGQVGIGHAVFRNVKR